MKTFFGCTALITGATAGLGREFARQLAPRAKVLILVGRRRERLEELEAELRRPGLAIRCHAVDLADPQAMETFLSSVNSGPDRIDLLINNAGVGDHGLFEDSEWNRVDAMIDVNVRALTRVTHALVPQLVSAGAGTILNVSSIAAFMPVTKMAVYAATKAYVSSFSEALRAELRGTDVTVTALCPGPIDTEFFERAERPGVESGVPTPEFFKVSAAQAVAEALDAAEADRARVVPGWQVWGVMALAALVPMALFRLFLPGRRS